MAKVPCAVERIFNSIEDEIERDAFIFLINTPVYSAGKVAELLHNQGYPGADRAAIGHFRRKLKLGKATLEFG